MSLTEGYTELTEAISDARVVEAAQKSPESVAVTVVMQSPERKQRALFFWEHLDKLLALKALVHYRTYVSASSLRESFVGATDGEDIYVPGFALGALNHAEMHHMVTHEHGHIESANGCTDCEIFAGFSEDQQVVLGELLGGMPHFTGRELTEGMNEAATRHQVGNNLNAYQDIVRFVESLEQLCMEKLGISLLQLFKSGSIREMQEWMRKLTGRALLKKSLEQEGVSPEERRFTLQLVRERYPHAKPKSLQEAHELVETVAAESTAMAAAYDEIELAAA